MTPHRPTTLRIAADHCLHALTLYEQGADQDPDMYATGTAAHEYLDAAARELDEDEVTDRLLTVGREGEDATGPLHPNHVYAGRALAWAWLEAHPLPEGVCSELRFAFRDGWRPTSWEDPACEHRTRIDYVQSTHEEDDDGHVYPKLVVRDYKTSWAVTHEDLEGEPPIQQKYQAVAVWRGLADESTAIIELQLASLRRLKVYSRRIVLDEDGVALLGRWARDIELYLRAATVTPRKPSPGMRCHGCSYAHACEHAAAAAQDPEQQVVARYVAARELVKALEKQVREQMQSRDPLRSDGVLVGFVPSESKTVLPGALADALEVASGGEVTAGLRIAAARIEEKLGATWLATTAKALFGKGRVVIDERRAWEDKHTETEIRPRWTVKRVK